MINISLMLNMKTINRAPLELGRLEHLSAPLPSRTFHQIRKRPGPKSSSRETRVATSGCWTSGIRNNGGLLTKVMTLAPYLSLLQRGGTLLHLKLNSGKSSPCTGTQWCFSKKANSMNCMKRMLISRIKSLIGSLQTV